MLVVNKKIFGFALKDIYFSDYPFDIDGCDSLKFLLCKNKVNAEGFTRWESPTLIIDLTQGLDAIWRNIKKRGREYIKQAQRDDIKIHVNSHYEQFYSLSHIHKKQLGVDLREKISTPKVETMKRYCTLFTAEHNNELLGGHLFLEDEAHIFLLDSASNRICTDREKITLIGRANRLLYWEAIKYANQKGLIEFDFGGLWPEEEVEKDKKKKGINFFKLSFGGEIVTRYSYQKVYSRLLNSAFSLYNLKDFNFSR